MVNSNIFYQKQRFLCVNISMNIIESKIPSPKSGEEQNNFVRRCMESSTMQKEFAKDKVRLAVCFSQYKKAKKNSNGVEVSWDSFENDSILIFI